MKKGFVVLILLLVSILLISGCAEKTEEISKEKPEQLPAEQPRKCGNEGEFCGGIAGIMCCQGLTCQYDGDYPDAGGECMKGATKKTS